MWPEVSGKNTVDDHPRGGPEPFQRRQIRFRSTRYTRGQKFLIKERKQLRITERSLKLYIKEDPRRTVPVETHINKVYEDSPDRQIFPKLK